MSDIDVENNLVIACNESVNWNQVFNKIKINQKYFDYANSLNNCVTNLIDFFQVPCARSIKNNIYT